MLWILVFNLISFSFASEPSSAVKFPASDVMNGYKYKDFEGFEKKWHLVTVRYRKDSGEMRFIYVNEKGWKTVKNGGKDFPEGTIFGKIGAIAEPDPAFASSEVPSGVRRYQFMVKNSKRHTDTNGWGYVLFDENKKTFPEDPKYSEKACAACHNIIPERGYVFAQLMNLTSRKSVLKEDTVNRKFLFISVQAKDLPETVRLNLPPNTEKVRSFSGSLLNDPFQGTLEEIIPTLTVETLRTKEPAVFVSQDKARFSLVYIDEMDTKCATLKKLSLISVTTKLSMGSAEEKTGFIVKHFCDE